MRVSRRTNCQSRVCRIPIRPDVRAASAAGLAEETSERRASSAQRSAARRLHWLPRYPTSSRGSECAGLRPPRPMSDRTTRAVPTPTARPSLFPSVVSFAGQLVDNRKDSRASVPAVLQSYLNARLSPQSATVIYPRASYMKAAHHVATLGTRRSGNRDRDYANSPAPIRGRAHKHMRPGGALWPARAPS